MAILFITLIFCVKVACFFLDFSYLKGTSDDLRKLEGPDSFGAQTPACISNCVQKNFSSYRDEAVVGSLLLFGGKLSSRSPKPELSVWKLTVTLENET